MFFFRRKKKAIQSRPSRSYVRRLPLSLEVLESRIVPAVDNWIAGSGFWDVGSNWDLGHAPTSSDSAVLNTSSFAIITIQPADNITVQNVNTGSNDTISFAGHNPSFPDGKLTLTSGSSTLNGGLSMDGGTLTVNAGVSLNLNNSLSLNGSKVTVTGSGASLTANGTTSIGDTNLYAEAGATLSLSQLTSYTASSVKNSDTFEANGSGSVLDVSGLTTATVTGPWAINALNGATVRLNSLTSLGSNSARVSLTDTGGSTLLDPSLTTLTNVGAIIATDAHVADSWKHFSGELDISGGTYNLPGLTDVSGSVRTVGGSLALPGLVSMPGGELLTNGVGSVLDASALTTVTTGTMALLAGGGGTLNVTGLTNLDSDLISVGNNGTLLVNSNITTLNNVHLDDDGTDVHLADNWTGFTNGYLSNTSVGSLIFPKLTNFSGSVIDDPGLSGGALQNFPTMTSGSVKLTNGVSIIVPGINMTLPVAGTTGAIINVPASQSLTVDLKNSGTLTNTTFNIGSGTTVILDGGIYAGTTLFNIAQGATLQVNPGTIIGPVVTANPSNQTVVAGQTATFTASASGTPTPMVQWQVSTDGGKTFSNISGATSTTLTLNNVTPDMNGNEYQAVFSNAGGIATTAAATLTVTSDPVAPSITGNPSNQTVTAGQSASFTASASGSPTPTVQWQVSSDSGKTFSNISGATGTTLTLNNVTTSMNGNEYQAVFSNGAGTATTSAATLTVQVAPSITGNPTNQAAVAGDNVSFTASANGNPTPTVQWQVSTDGGKTFTTISGATSTTLTLNNVTLAMNGNEYLAVFTNSVGSITTNAATLTVTAAPSAPVISGNPSNQTVTAGQSATFTASASGSPTPTVQWQLSTDGGKTFTNISGATSTTLTLNNVTLAMNGNEYQAVFSNSAGTATSSAATLTVTAAGSAPVVTLNPSSQMVMSGQSVVFTAAASGAPTPTAQWQVSTDGGMTFTNISGATSTTLTLNNVSTTMNGYEYQAVFSNSAGNATSSAATLTVSAPPPAPPAPPAPPSPPAAPPLQVPPLLSFFNSFLAGVETINANGTATITDSFFGIPLIVSTFDSAGHLMSVTLFGIDITFLFG